MGVKMYLSHRGKNIRLRVFGNRPLRKVFGPKNDHLIDDCNKLYNEELTKLYSSPNIILLMKSRKMGWTEHVTRMGTGELYTRFWWENLTERDHFKNIGVERRITFK
jgi:hypothetical protein